MAHIGVIRMLEELHIPIDYVAGTSMGSIIGGLYSCGFTPDEMEKVIKAINWGTLFEDAPERAQQSFRQKEDDFDHLIPLEFGLNLKKGGLVLPPGLIAGSKLGFVLQSATLPCSTVANFDDYRIPFRAVATDIQTGQPYVMSKGNLARVIRASMAIPAIFTPVEIDGHLLIDGGESENLPVQTVAGHGRRHRDRGQRRLLRRGDRRGKPTNVGGMISRLIDLPLQQNTMASAKLATIVITPNLEGYTSADFLKGTEMIPLGYKAAEAAAGEARGVVGARERLRRLEAAPRRAAAAAAVHRRGRHRAGARASTRGGITYLVESKAGRVLDTKILGRRPQADLRDGHLRDRQLLDHPGRQEATSSASRRRRSPGARRT